MLINKNDKRVSKALQKGKFATFERVKFVESKDINFIEREARDKITKKYMQNEVDVIYRSLVSLAEDGLKEINLPFGKWVFIKDRE